MTPRHPFPLVPCYSTLEIPVAARGESGAARRAAVAWAREAHLDEATAATVALIASELATNLELHTTNGGRLLLRRSPGSDGYGASILAIDRGPGRENFSLCMRDGYSTAGTAGIGLGAVRRLASHFDVHSLAGAGTVVHAAVEPAGHPANESPVGAVSVALHGQVACGDSWAVMTGQGWARCLVADGLGHGPMAAEASHLAREIFLSHPQLGLIDLLQRMHVQLRTTRGAAAAVAHLDHRLGRLYFAGIGNIAGSIVSDDGIQSLVSHNGTLGGSMPGNPRQFEHPWRRGSTLIMHSDGIRPQWQMREVPGLWNRHPEVVAGVLFRDHARPTDDATVLVHRPLP